MPEVRKEKPFTTLEGSIFLSIVNYKAVENIVFRNSIK